jgi:hypothetical protein
MSSSAITGPLLSNVSRSADGAEAAPSWSFQNSPTMGFYRVSANVLGLSTAGVQRMVVDASGNVGIGTASPSHLLVVNHPTDARIRLENAGVALGQIQVTNNEVRLHNITTNPVSLWTSGQQRMTIDANGNLLVGQTTLASPPTSVADIYTGGLFINPSRRTAANAASAYWEASTGVFYRSTSSLRYKTNVQDYSKGLSEVMAMRPVSFNPKEGDRQSRIYAGFIAEEVDSLGMTEFVEYDAEGKPDSIGYAQITALLTKAIQEQQAMIEELKAKVAALESK